jgi:hypothetical protein
MIRKCVICGMEFNVPPSSKKVTCSDPCRRERASRVNLGSKHPWSESSRAKLSERGQTENLLKGTIAALESPLSGPFESNINALDWVIRSPEGTTYTVRNLNLWLRENADLLPGTPEQARAGIMQIKRSRLGKTKRSVNQWKGWRLLEWGE